MLERMTLAWIALLVASSMAAAAGPAAPMPVGVARVDVTPDYPVLLNGYASRPAQEFDAVHQRLYARAVAIGGHAAGEGGKPIVIISVDNLGIPAAVRDAVAAALEASHGVDPAAVAVCATHTHAAPWVSGVAPNILVRDLTPQQQATVDRYTAELTQKMIEAGRSALQSRKPAALTYAIGRGAFAMNRRTGGGPTDHDLPVLRAVDAGGKPVAFVVGYACHCTTLGGVPFMCGDWAGYCSQALERMYDGAIALTIIGCGADQNPNKGGGPEVAQQHGRSIAAEVQRLAGEPARTLAGPIHAAMSVLELPMQTLPARPQLEAQAKDSGIVGYRARKNLARLGRGEALPTHIPVPVQTLAIGDGLAMVLLGHEVVVDYSIRIKNEFDRTRMWAVGYANDERCYLPSERVLREGGYEGGDAMVWYDWPMPFAPGLEQKIMDAVHAQTPAAFKQRVSDANAWAPDTVAPIPGTDDSKPLSPRAAIASMRVGPQFAVELVAAEPLVADPVAIAWGPDGRLWVCEYHDYPDGLDGKLAPGGRVKVLTDTDGDGRYDKAGVFLDGIAFPTGVTVWRNGVLISAAPDVIYAEDTDGDGKADVKKVLLSGFATHNYQARVNSLEYGLDGWVYGACGLFGGHIASFNGTKLNLERRDFRFNPDTGEFESAVGGTQQGRVRNDAGDWFGCHNGSLLDHYPLADHWLGRNPHVAPPPTTRPIGNARVFPAAPPLMFASSGQVGGITSACGIGVYRDTLLGAAVYGDAFSCEPVHMCVSRIDLTPEAGLITGRRDPAEADREFWSSTDPWHRPVQVRTGPDGALYIVDMYRYIIEHPRFIPDARKAKLNPRAGDGLGRIWRIVPADGTKRPIVRLDKLSGRELAAAMDSPNGPQRDMAMQLIAWRDDKLAAAALPDVATGSEHAAARAQALATLDRHAAMSAPLLLSAMGDGEVIVRRAAARIAPRHAAAMPQVADAIAKLAADQDAHVRLDLAAALPRWDDGRAGEVLGRMLATEEHAYVRATAMCSVVPQLGRVIASALEAGADAAVVQQLLTVAIASGDAAALGAMIDRLARPQEGGGYSDAQFAACVGMVEALARSGRTLASLRDGADAGLGAALDRLSAMTAAARSLAGDGAADAGRRTAAAALLGCEPAQYDTDAALLTDMLKPGAPPSVQQAAVAGFGRIDRPQSAASLIAGWTGYTPDLRRHVIDALLARPAWTGSLVEAIKANPSIGASLDAARRQRLLNHEAEPVRLAAAQALGTPTDPSRHKALDRYLAAVTSPGDADRGKLVYAQTCIACHQYRGEGHAIGPNLDAITDRSIAGLLTAIIDPNRGVSDEYVGYLISTRDGRTISGVVAEETATTIVVKDLAAQTHTVLRSDVASVASTGRSLMPDGLEAAITPAQMADLIAYLGGRRVVTYRYVGDLPPQQRYPDTDPPTKLTDGLVGSDNFTDGKWVGYWHNGTGRNAAIVFDLGRSQPLGTIGLIYAVNHKPGGVHAPEVIRIGVSDDPSKFDSPVEARGFDNSPDGRPAYHLDRRVASVKLDGRTGRYVRVDVINTREWSFLTEVRFNHDDDAAGAAAKSPDPADPAPPPNDAADRIADLTRDLAPDRPSQYARIPAIFREAVAAGKRNDAAELRRVIEVSTPQIDAPLTDWEAVAIGGGVINGLTQAGVWPHQRIAELLKDDAALRARFERSLVESVKMADDEQVPHGTRYDALRMIPLLPWATCGPQLERYLAAGVNAELQMGAVSGLGDVPHIDAADLLIKAIAHLEGQNRNLAVAALRRSPQRAARALAAIERGELDPARIGDASVQAMKKLAAEQTPEQSARPQRSSPPDRERYVIAPGRFEPTWDSLMQYRCPDWFRDAKFGIWAHYGPQCEPEQGDWYARNMYIQGERRYEYHVKTYGHPSQFGFKDVINQWKAQRLDPEALMDLYQRAGAGYFVAMANHHCNFDMWDSKHQPWNSVNLGPGRDMMADWAAAARKRGIRFGVSVHNARAWDWYSVAHGSDKDGPLAGVPYDGALTKADGEGKWWAGYDPADLYGPHGDARTPAARQRYIDNWFDRTKDLIDQHRPDLLYFDDVNLPLGQAGMHIGAHYYNASESWNTGRLEAVLNSKRAPPGRREAIVLDLERTSRGSLDPLPWQTDTCIGNWHYKRDIDWYKNPRDVVRQLVDTVSKNGNLLLSIPIRADGTLDDREIAFLEAMAAWMKVNREAIVGTRPWTVFGEGASGSGGTVAEGDARGYTSADLRFTAKGGTLYAVALGWPQDRKLVVRSLAEGKSGGRIDGVSLLGHAGTLQWKREADGLVVTLPQDRPCDHAWALKIQGDALTPAVLETDRSVEPDADGRIFLGANAASIHGYSPQWKLHDKADPVGRIGDWHDGSHTVTWQVRVNEGETYNVGVEYGCQTNCAGGAYTIQVGGQSVAGVVGPTGTWDNYKRQNIGSIRIGPGTHTLRFRPTFDGWNSLHLRSITLTPTR